MIQHKTAKELGLTKEELAEQVKLAEEIITEILLEESHKDSITEQEPGITERENLGIGSADSQ